MVISPLFGIILVALLPSIKDATNSNTHAKCAMCAEPILKEAINQSDEIVVVDKTGRAIAKLGDFDGLRGGAPVGLLFPASLARSGE